MRINDVTLRDQSGGVPSSWSVSGSGTNYRLIDATDSVDVRIDDLVDLANTPAPQGIFDIVGVVSQYKTASPFIGGYQIMPRSQQDIKAIGAGYCDCARRERPDPDVAPDLVDHRATGDDPSAVGTTSSFEKRCGRSRFDHAHCAQRRYHKSGTSDVLHRSGDFGRRRR